MKDNKESTIKVIVRSRPFLKDENGLKCLTFEENTALLYRPEMVEEQTKYKFESKSNPSFSNQIFHS